MNDIYAGAKTIDCVMGDNIVVGEGSFLRRCRLGDYVQINRRNVLEDVTAGECTYTGPNTVLKHVTIGRYCAISWNVSATGNMHDYTRGSIHPFTQLRSFGFVGRNTSLEHEAITIGNDAWIGANSCVLPGVSVGDGAVIGAGAVVTTDVPPYAIAVGNPARVIKYRFDDETIALLLEARWWDFPRELIEGHISLFRRHMSREVALELVDLSKDCG